MSMYESFNCSGEWWFPAHPERTVMGNLYFDPEKGFKLNLMGSLCPRTNSKAKQHPAIILGLTKEHGEITLFQCIHNSEPIRVKKMNCGKYHEFSESVFSPQYILTGAHFLKQEDLQFEKMIIRYTNFDEWVDISGFTLSDFNENNQFDMKYSSPPDIHVQLNNECSVSIEFNFQYPSYNFLQKEVICKQDISLCIEFLDKTPFKKFMEVIYSFKNFLSFAVNEPVYLKNIIGVTGNPYTSSSNNNLNKKLIVNLMNEKFCELLPPKKERLSPNMLFSYPDIAPKFDAILKKWFLNSEKFEPVFNLYFLTIYNHELVLENQFLNLIQAIEAYHRRAFTQQIEPDVNHQKKMNEILTSVPEAYKEWIRKKLEYSNEKYLAIKLSDILKKNPQMSQLLFIDEKTRKKFIYEVTNARNIFTHWDPERKPVEFEKLHLYVKKLKLLLGMCILSEFGFSAEESVKYSEKLFNESEKGILIQFD